jgi:hypothetical protein
MLLVALLLRERRRSRQTRYQRERGKDFPLKHDEPLVQPATRIYGAVPASLIWIKSIVIGFPLDTKPTG